MNYKITCSKKLRFVFLFLVVLISAGTVAQKKDIKYIEGLFYIDHSPVRLEIANGKITNIIRIKELSEKGENIYIAPDLLVTR